MLNWFSLNLEMPDCGLEIGQRLTLLPINASGQVGAAEAAPDDGIANCPPGRRAFRIDSETGFIWAAVSPKVAARPTAVRFVSVRPSGIDGKVRLLLSESPLRSRVP